MESVECTKNYICFNSIRNTLSKIVIDSKGQFWKFIINRPEKSLGCFTRYKVLDEQNIENKPSSKL